MSIWAMEGVFVVFGSKQVEKAKVGVIPVSHDCATERISDWLENEKKGLLSLQSNESLNLQLQFSSCFN